MKQCKTCTDFKPFEEFPKLSRSPDGYYFHCKSCKGKTDRLNYQKNKEKIKARASQYYEENKDKVLKNRNDKKEHYSEYNRNYKKVKKEKISVYNKEYRKDTAEERSLYKKEYRKNNKEKINKSYSNWLKKNPKARVAKSLRNRINEIIRTKDYTKSKGLYDVLECTGDQLKIHLESLFQLGMTWDNYGEWEIDHIIPLSSASDESRLYELSHYKNLQPLWEKDNLIKGNREVPICWQKLQRDKLLQEDTEKGLPLDTKASEFIVSEEQFSPEHREFIRRYEWLGDVGFGVRWVFTARHNGVLGGVVMISEPNSYQFGKVEALIQRGACASWTPKNLGSRLVMFACRWMVQNTDKRIFVAYSDPEAGEIGTIYQACNFDYLGKGFGSTEMYLLDSGKEVSSRYFTRTSSMKKWAKEVGIEWKKEWQKENGFQDPKLVPNELKDYASRKMAESPKMNRETKGKYALLLNGSREFMKKPWESKPYPKRK